MYIYKYANVYAYKYMYKYVEIKGIYLPINILVSLK